MLYLTAYGPISRSHNPPLLHQIPNSKMAMACDVIENHKGLRRNK